MSAVCARCKTGASQPLRFKIHFFDFEKIFFR
jgi:hypothetical protein